MVISLTQEVILFHILTKVPATSVYRFKLVSKQWNSFLSNDMFKQMHNRNIDHHQSDLKLLQLSKTTNTSLFSIINCEAPCVLSPCNRPLPPPFIAAGSRNICTLASFHGLVCVGITKYQYEYVYTELILWNPLTTEHKMLSRSSSKSDHVECYATFGRAYGLYYSSSQDDYKLLLVTHLGNVYIYSLKSDSWIKLNKAFQSYKIWRPSACLNENLYFLITQRIDNRKSYSIMRFDTKTEELQKLETPSVYDNNQNSDYYATIMVQRGCIHFCVKYNIGRTHFLRSSNCIELWKLNGDNWRKVVTYQLRPHDIGSLCPLQLMKNGNWLMTESGSGGYICIVNLKKIKKYSNHKIKGKGKNKSKGDGIMYVDNIRVGIHQEVQYIETFMSPNRYLK